MVWGFVADTDTPVFAAPPVLLLPGATAETLADVPVAIVLVFVTVRALRPSDPNREAPVRLERADAAPVGPVLLLAVVLSPVSLVLTLRVVAVVGFAADTAGLAADAVTGTAPVVESERALATDVVPGAARPDALPLLVSRPVPVTFKLRGLEMLDFRSDAAVPAPIRVAVDLDWDTVLDRPDRMCDTPPQPRKISGISFWNRVLKIQIRDSIHQVMECWFRCSDIAARDWMALG